MTDKADGVSDTSLEKDSSQAAGDGRKSVCAGLLPWERLLGILPLAFYSIHFAYNWRLGNPGHGLWMCHVSNIMLGLGLLFARPALIRLAVIWQIPAIPLWAMDMMRTGQMPVITFFSHLGGAAVGIYGLARVRASRWMWLYAWAWFLALQQVTRVLAPPELNVNVAQSIYPGWERFFSAYWQYWLFIVLTSAGGLWVLGRILYGLCSPAASSKQD